MDGALEVAATITKMVNFLLDDDKSLHHGESRWRFHLPKGGIVRGHDKPRLMGVVPSILSRWYTQKNGGW